MSAPKYVIAPEGCCEHLTPGKRYEVRNPDSKGFYFTSDDGHHGYARFTGCAYLNGGDWIIPQTEDASCSN